METVCVCVCVCVCMCAVDDSGEIHLSQQLCLTGLWRVYDTVEIWVITLIYVCEGFHL